MPANDAGLTQLNEAIQRFDEPAARRGLAAIQARLQAGQAVFDDDSSRQLLTRLVDNRWFGLADSLGHMLTQVGGLSPTVRRRIAQIQMERGHLDLALQTLDDLRQQPGLPQAQMDEVMGHIGRLRKEQFLASCRAGMASPERLQQAIDAYLGRYLRSPGDRLWHGINAVALLKLAARQPEPPAAASAQADAMASAILDAVIEKRDARMATAYDRATAAEACLALGQYEQALPWLQDYVEDPTITVFQLGATLRQFEQLWRLDDAPAPGPELLDLLRMTQATRLNGALAFDGAMLRGQQRRLAELQLESVFAGDRFDTFKNYRDGMARFECVVRVSAQDGSGGGSGFVIPGRLLSDKLPDALMLVTNAHVLSIDAAQRAAGALHPDEAVVRFHACDQVSNDDDFRLGAPLFYSPPDQLDVAIAPFLEPSPPAPRTPYAVASVLPIPGESTQIRIIGHPQGGGLSLSVNCFLAHQAHRLHYRTATEGGSSGSPAFTRDWRLLGLHHAGGPLRRLDGSGELYDANEGIAIASIQAWIGSLPADAGS